MHWNWRRKFAAFAVLLFGACSSVCAQSQSPNVLKLNLEDYGWHPLPKEQPDEWGGTRSRLVSVDHQGRVLVGFTVRENHSLATRENPELAFHILRFTSDGKVDLSLVLPTNSFFTNGLYLGPHDKSLLALTVHSSGCQKTMPGKKVQIGVLSYLVRRTVVSASHLAVAL